jgi:hypothetical protein
MQSNSKKLSSSVASIISKAHDGPQLETASSEVGRLLVQVDADNKSTFAAAFKSLTRLSEILVDVMIRQEELTGSVIRL